MNISDERLTEFIDLYHAEFGERLERIEAYKAVSDMVRLTEILMGFTPAIGSSNYSDIIE